MRIKEENQRLRRLAPVSNSKIQIQTTNSSKTGTTTAGAAALTSESSTAEDIVTSLIDGIGILPREDAANGGSDPSTAVSIYKELLSGLAQQLVDLKYRYSTVQYSTALSTLSAVAVYLYYKQYTQHQSIILLYHVFASIVSVLNIVTHLPLLTSIMLLLLFFYCFC